MYAVAHRATPRAKSSAKRRPRLPSRSSHSPTRTSSPCRNVWPRARNAAAAHSHPVMSSAPRIRMPKLRPIACASITTPIRTRHTAAATAAAAYRRSRNRLKMLLAAVSFDDGLPLGAGLLQPLVEDLRTDLGVGRLHRRVGLVQRHAV